MSQPVVYLVLGCKGSGQFQVVSDLIEFGTQADESSIALHAASDQAEAEQDFSVKTREAALAQYEFDGHSLRADLPPEADVVFMVAEGLANPADFVEAFRGWLESGQFVLGRVITVLHTQLALSDEEAFHWFECCIHFSDVVLLNRREEVSNKQIKVLLDYYSEKERMPCVFDYVKKGRVSNPGLVLEMQARRLTRIFEKPEIFDDDDEEDDLQDEQLAGDLSSDKYLQKAADGRRAIPLPDVSKWIRAE